MLVLNDFRMVERIRVLTGKPGSPGHDILERGVLDVSPDGRAFTQVSVFADGRALYSPQNSVLVKAVRIRMTGPQRNWLVVREILLE